jgi:tetratricopeptide (TPR) repeat protein
MSTLPLRFVKHCFLVALLLSGTLAAAAAGDTGACNGHGVGADQQIAACTRLIAAGRLDPRELPLAYVQRGNAWQDKGDQERAIQDYSRAIQADPRFAGAYNNRAWAYHRVGQPDRGLPDADRAVQLAPREPNFLDTRARILIGLGRKQEAARDLRAALALRPSDDRLRESIVQALQRLGERL